jgi:hypothetical protein
MYCDHGILHAQNVSMKGSDFDIRMSFQNFDIVPKVYRTVTFDLDNFGVCFSDFKVLSHIKIVGKELIFFGIDNWKGMDRDQDLVTITMNSYRIIEVLVLIVRSELNVYVLGDT